jgi:predicted DNA-binding transcriptional regulator AlpA
MQKLSPSYEPLLREIEAADILGVSVWWLRKHRCRGTGPAYIRVGGLANGAVRYRLCDLRAWIEENRIIPIILRQG